MRILPQSARGGGEWPTEISKPVDRLNSCAASVVQVTLFLCLAGGVTVIVNCCLPDHPTSLQVNCGQVRVGMTLAEVEAILGPGTKMAAAPRDRNGPVVKGDAVYYWNGSTSYPETVVIGFRYGVVVDKLYRDMNYI